MGDRHDYVALDWVKGEISETLGQARQALEAYVENPEDSTRLRFCLTYIHQVHGTLQMVEFYGAALLAEEMEKLAQALMHRTAAREAEALEVLMQSILQMPAYLDRVQTGRRDLPLILLPLLNDMRTARGEKLLSENALFSPELVEPPGDRPDTGSFLATDFGDDAIARQLRKLRQALQMSQAGIIREQDVPANSRQLGRVYARLESLFKGAPYAELWTIFAGVAEGLEHGTIETGAAVRHLLRQGDRELRQLMGKGKDAFAEKPAPELARNLLFYIAKSDGDSPRLESLKDRYQLRSLWTQADRDAQASGNRLVGPDRGAMQSVVVALGEELLQVKDRLDLFVRSDRSNPGILSEMLPTLKQIADTLAMLGLGQPRRVLQEQIEQVALLASSDAASTDAALMDIAGGLLYVEASLQGISGQGREDGGAEAGDSDMQRLTAAQDMGQVQQQVVYEARNALEQTREAVNAFIADHWNHEQLAPADDLLNSVRGSLAMINLARASEVVSACRLYLVEQLIEPKATPDWEALDALADVITSIDYYLERLAEDDIDRGDSILAVAQERLAVLQYDRESIEARKRSAELSDAESGLDKPGADASGMDQHSVAAVVVAPEEEFEEIDEELLEIFIEEAGEVLESLAEFTPIWQDDPDNHKARTEVRRSFHTLKGSGRMVRAGILAELAWSVENLLNRVIDRSVELTPTVFTLVDEVRALMPRLVEDFAAHAQRQLPEVTRLMSHAEALSKGLPLPRDVVEELEQGEALDSSEPMQAESDDVSVLDAVELLEPLMEIGEEPEVERDPDAEPQPDIEPQYEPEPEIEPEDEPQPEVEPEQEPEPEYSAVVGPESLEDTLVETAESLPVPEVKLAEAATSGMDPVLLEIFRNETQVHLNEIREFLDRCSESLPRTISDALQRALHTLKGSAHMAGIQPIAALTTPLEKLAKDFKANLIPADHSVAAALHEALGMIEVGIAQLDTDPQQMVPGTDEFVERVRSLHSLALQARESARAGADGPQADESSLLSIFLTEGIDLLLDTADDLNAWNPDQRSIDSQGLIAALGELADVAGDVELPTLQELCLALEEVHEAIDGQRLELTVASASTLAIGHERLIGMMDQVAAHQHVAPAVEEIAALQALFPHSQVSTGEQTEASAVPPSNLVAVIESGSWNPADAVTDAELVDIFLEEAQEIIDSSTESLQKWLDDTGNSIAVEALQRDLHTLKGGARMAEIKPVGDLAHELEFVYEGICDLRYVPSEHLSALLHACHDSLAEMVEGVVAGRTISDGMALIEAIRAYRARPDKPMRLPGQDMPAEADGSEVETEEPAPVVQPEKSFGQPLQGMLNMFLEEARELLEPCHQLLGQRASDPGAARNLVHRIQTLKGSARLASQHALAEQAKALEAALLDVEPARSGALDLAITSLQAALEALAAGQDISPADWTRFTAKPDADVAAPFAEYIEAVKPAQSGQTLAEVKAILQQAMDAGAERSGPGSRSSGQETVKVPAGLLEDLVNLAGETSIFRGRIEQQVLDLSHTLTDVESTIERVRDQLRRLDMETQSQILSRHQEDIEQGYEDFDPLEMDRYSQLQQLSRSLFESASDLLDLKETLAAKSRDAETLLLQQARVNTELQEGLMRTRMVPFERLLPRMRRVVRQVAGELGKQVELVVGNAEGEMDRSVLERMIGPLEHMLRNAVDHGIEMPEDRAAGGKEEEGRITLGLRREGGEIVLQLADDGAGINLDAVRSKAVDRGLMDADAQLTDQEVLEFILEAGFSTAQKVTQISGRGVGMDVVNAEVKQLGGSMSLETEPGKGSVFTIRLPFTVSVNRALMVYSGEDLFAIPLNTIEGIVRVSGYELEAYYAPDAPPFEYAGKTYDLRYLGELLVTGQQPRLTGHSLPLPVILVRGTEHSMAVQVDALAGSREIVVKSLGRQFAVVPGISGATILGDGRVVVILDLLAVIRAQQALHSQQRLAAERAQANAQPAKRTTLVMVVDDSITVRKVTTRLLERHGMEVITAKDGVEAIARLQDVQPDIMLLDIEMPRMDGFEVATLVRHDERLHDLPIIMITSRTGEKHRERARSIGVNEYLGKPYQETQLLEVIGKLVTIRE